MVTGYRASLAVQGLRICLAKEKTRLRDLVGEPRSHVKTTGATEVRQLPTTEPELLIPQNKTLELRNKRDI